MTGVYRNCGELFIVNLNCPARLSSVKPCRLTRSEAAMLYLTLVVIEVKVKRKHVINAIVLINSLHYFVLFKQQ